MKYLSINSLIIFNLFFTLLIYSNNMFGQIVVIDAGHGYNRDCSNGDGRTETEINTNYAVSVKLKYILEASNYTVYLTRTSNGCDSWISVDQRAYLSNSWGANILLSIHCNAGGGSVTETFYCEKNDPDVNPDKAFAEDVQSEMAYYGEWTNRRTVEDYSYLGYHLGVLSQTNATGCLNEIGFVDNLDDAAKLLDDNWRDEFAYAYAWAISDVPTGLEDHISLRLDIDHFNTNYPYLDVAHYNFVDEWPNGDYIVQWGNLKVTASNGCENITLMDTPYNDIYIPNLPEGYLWERDQDGNVIALLTKSGIDNDGYYHEASVPIYIQNVPNTFITSGTLTSNTFWCGNINLTGYRTIRNNLDSQP